MNIRHRLGFKFWLDSRNPKEAAIIQEIELLKATRSFTATIRDGIRLMQSLRQGKLDVLQELFPWVLEQPVKKNEENMVRDDMLQAQLEQIQQLLSQNTSVKPTKKPLPTLSSVSNHQDLEIKAAKSNENPSYNLQLSGVGIGAIKLHDLSSDCLQYGLDMNKFSPSVTKQVRELLKSRGVAAKEKSPPKAQAKPGGPKKMDVPDIAPPPIDDDIDDSDLLVLSTSAV